MHLDAVDMCFFCLPKCEHVDLSGRPVDPHDDAVWLLVYFTAMAIANTSEHGPT